MKIVKPDLDPIASRVENAARLFAPLLPDELDCAALYLCSDTHDFDVETHKLILVTDSTIELLECSIDNPDWADRAEFGPSVTRESALRSLTALSLSNLVSVQTTEDLGGWRGRGNQPEPRQTFTIELAQPLGSLGSTITLPLHRKRAYDRESPERPEKDAEDVARALTDYLRRTSRPPKA